MSAQSSPPFDARGSAVDILTLQSLPVSLHCRQEDRSGWPELTVWKTGRKTRQTVTVSWHTQRCINNDARIAAIHARFADMWLVTPVGPVQEALAWIQGDGPRLLQSFVQENFAVLSIQLGHFDCVRFLVTPIQIASDPIDGQTIRILQSWRVQRLLEGNHKKTNVRKPEHAQTFPFLFLNVRIVTWCCSWAVSLPQSRLRLEPYSVTSDQ